MTRHEYSGATLASTSTLLESAEVIALPTARRCRAEPGTFTKSTVRKMQCPPGQSEGFFWDASCRGFGIRALRSGRRSWIYQYRDEHGRTRRIVLGDVSAVSLDNARNAARRTAASVAHGSNPSVDRKKKANCQELSWRSSKPIWLMQKGAKSPALTKRPNDICAATRPHFIMTAPKPWVGLTLPRP